VTPDCDKSCPFVIICFTSVPTALLKADWTSVSLSWTGHAYGEARFPTWIRSRLSLPPDLPRLISHRLE
jgi:hypothetical protein